MMMDISRTSEVAAVSTLGMGLRCASAAGLTLGSLLFGARIVPVTGKLPFPLLLLHDWPLHSILGTCPDMHLSTAAIWRSYWPVSAQHALCLPSVFQRLILVYMGHVTPSSACDALVCQNDSSPPPGVVESWELQGSNL